MTDVTIRDLSEETYRAALQVRAAEHTRSVEAEILFILEEVMHPKDRVKIGTELAEFGRQIGGL